MSQQKLPSFQFYPGDWMKDPDLRRCSKAAIGMAIDTLCLMFECKERGVLSSANGPWSDREIAAAVGGDISENLTLLGELLAKEAFSRNTSGAVFSRRMVRDEHLRQVRSTAGKAGGTTTGNLLKQNAKQTASKTPAKSGSSSSASSSPSGKDKTVLAAQEQATAVASRKAAVEPDKNPDLLTQRTQRSRILTDQQNATWKSFQDWWVGVWPRFHGGIEYEYAGNRDAPAALRFLKRQLIAWDLTRAKDVALHYLGQPEVYGLHDHPIVTLAARGNYYARKLDEFRAGGTNVIGIAGTREKPTAIQRGQFESDRNVPISGGVATAAG